MGGRGSSRWRAHARRATTDEVEQQGITAVPVRVFREMLTAERGSAGAMQTRGATHAWAVTPGPLGRRVWWCASLADAARLARVAHPAEPDLALGVTPSPESHAQVDAEAVRLRTPTGCDGVRWWWRCPGCAARRAVLYLAPVREQPTLVAPRCRRCLGLVYLSQRLARQERLRLACARGARALGASWLEERDACEVTPVRPAGMRQATYARRARDLERSQLRYWQAIDAEIAAFVARLTRRERRRTRGSRA